MIRKIMTYFLFSIMSLQILLGSVWVVGNFNSMQQFGESYEYIEISDSYVLDEYTGVLYPILIEGAKLLEEVTTLPFYIFLYLLQLGIGIISMFYFTNLIFNKKYNLVVALYLTTIPFVLQFHMAILETSLVTSITMCLIAKGLSMVLGLEENKIKFEYGELENNKRYRKRFQNILIICLLWTLSALLSPDYMYLSGSFVAIILLMVSHGSNKEKVEIRRENVVVVKHLRNKNKMIIKIFTTTGVILLTSLLIMSIEGNVQKSGSRNRMEQSIEACMFSRVVTPSLSTNYYFWPEEVKQIMTIEEAKMISKRVDNVTEILGPQFETTFGKNQAKQYYKQMTIRCLQDRTKEVIERIWNDGIDYTLMPLTVVKNISGEGNSNTGWNLSRMKDHMPEFTTGYFLYGLTNLVFIMSLVILKILYLIFWKYGKHIVNKIIDFKKKSNEKINNALLNTINQREEDWNEDSTSKIKKLLICCFPILSGIIWYTLSSGEYVDYKNATIIIIFWYFYPIYFLVKDQRV